MDDDERVDPAATLIVTRPEPEAGRLVSALIANGRRAWALPVLAIEDVVDVASVRQVLATIDRYALVVFVSPNAIRRALALRDAPWPHDVTIGVMGPGSVETLGALGIAAPAYRVVAPRLVAMAERDGDRFDSEALFEALELRPDFAGRVLIVRGNGGRAWFGDRLRGLGIAVDEVEAYRRGRPVADAPQVEAFAPRQRRRDAAGVHRDQLGGRRPPGRDRRGGAGGFHVRPEAVRAWLFDCTIVAPHGRIAANARQVGFRRVVTTASGDRGILAGLAADSPH